MPKARQKQWLLPISVLLLLSTSVSIEAKLKPEDVLGEYWKDPLFGQAAGNVIVKLELLYKLIWPKNLDVRAGQKARFVFDNKGEETHIMAFSKNPDEFVVDPRVVKDLEDVLFHLKQKKQFSNNHQHSDTDVENVQEFVKILDDIPLIVVEAGGKKEIVMKFEEPNEIKVFCVLDDHRNQGYRSRIVVKPVLD